MTSLPTRPHRAVLLSALGALALSAAPAAAQQPAAPPPAAPAATPAADTGRALSLDDAMQLALQRSEVVRIAGAGVQRARGQVMQARSQLLPQLNGTAAYQRALQNQFDAINERFASAGPTGPQPKPLCRAPADTVAPYTPIACPEQGDPFGAISQIFAAPNTIILGVTGSQVLFAGGRVWSGIRAATAGRTAAEIGLAASQAQLRYDVAQAYFDAQLADRLRVIAESSYVQSERAYRQTALARQVGNVSEFELLRARVTRDNVRPQVIQARTMRDVAVVRLRQLLDLPATTPLRLTTDIESGVPTAPPPPRFAADTTPTRVRTAAEARAAVDVDVEALLAADAAVLAQVDSVVAASDTTSETRATVRQAQENVEARRNLLRVARAQRLPAVQLSTNYQRFAYPPDQLSGFPTSTADYYPNWTVTLGVAVPIFTGFRIRGEEMVAQADLVEAREQLQLARELAALDAQVAVAALQQAQSAWVASLGTAEQATRAYSIADVRYREGISTQLELSESRVQLQQAMANRASAARDLQVARMRLALLRDLPLQQPGAAQQAPGAGGQSQQQQPRSQQSNTRQAAGAGAPGSPATGTFQ